MSFIPPFTLGSIERTTARAGGVLFILWLLTGLCYGFNPADLEKVKNTNRCEECDLTGADMAGSVMNDVRLANAKIAGAKMAGADLSSGDLSGADLSGADLSRADLSYTNLWHARLPKANLSGGRLIGARLQGADLSGANLAAADLSGANLSGATWTDGKKCLEGSTGSCKTGASESEKRPPKERGLPRTHLIPPPQ
jgi:uncharacterized protein YjbI with pentapeptide repeats